MSSMDANANASDGVLIEKPPKVTSGQLKAAGSGAVAEAKNYFIELLPDAISELRHTLKMSKNEKLRTEVAESIIEKAGAGGQPKTGQVVINDSQVLLLTGTLREVLGDG